MISGIVGGGMVAASPASAAEGNFYYHWHSWSYAYDHGAECNHGLGAYRSFAGDDKNLADNYFNTICSAAQGGGKVVKNNAGGGINYYQQRVRVYYNSYSIMGCWCGSSYDTFAADNSAGGDGVRRDLSNTYNNNASHHFLSN